MNAATICPLLKNFYRTNQIYTDTDLFFESCGDCTSSSSLVHIYNKFIAGLPSNNEEFVQQGELLRNEVSNNPDLIYNIMLDNVWPNFNYTHIPQFSSIASVAPILLANNIQSNYSGTVVAACYGDTLYICKKGIVLLNTLINIKSFCVVGSTNYIYYMNIDDEMFLYNVDTSEVERIYIPIQPVLEVTNKLVSCGILGTSLVKLQTTSNILITAQTTVYKFDFTAFAWIQIQSPQIFSQYTFTAIDVAGTALFVMTESGESSKGFISYPFGSNFQEISILTGQSLLQCAPTLLANNESGGLNLLCIALQQIRIYDIINQTLVTILSQPSGQLRSLDWGITYNNIVCATTTAIYNNNFYNSTDWIKIAHVLNPNLLPHFNLVASGSRAYYVDHLSDSDTSVVIKCVITQPEALSFIINLSHAQNLKIYLFDNGEIRCYEHESFDEFTIPLFISSTNDQTIPTITQMMRNEYVPILPTNSITVSANGLYILVLDTSLQRYRLYQNVINTSAIVRWQGLATEGDLRVLYEVGYCDKMPKNNLTGEFTNTFPDPRCLCFQPKELVAKLFNLSLLSTNPTQLQLLYSLVPCITKTCMRSKSTTSILSQYMNTEITCDKTINICTTVLDAGVGGSIEVGQANIESNCGTNAGKTPCSSTCPVGTACASNGYCALVCKVDSDCGTGYCKGGICEFENINSKASLSTWIIALIVVGIVILLVGISVAIFFARKHK